MAVVVLLLVCGWISIVNAQSDTVIISPQGHQSVCRGESISYNCIGNGTDMVLYSPPIVNQSNALIVGSGDSVPSCNAIQNSGASIVLVDFSGNPSFMGTFTLYISDEQREGQRTVFCQVTSADGTITNEATFSVLGAPSRASSLTFQKTAPLSGDMAQVAVNVSWDSPEYAQEFMLQIRNMDYTNTIRSFENSVTVLLPYAIGSYSATLCAINRCGETCRDYRNIFSAQQPPTDTDNSLLIAAVIAGVLGFLLILSSIYGITVTVMVCKKNNARPIAANEAKEMQMD